MSDPLQATPSPPRSLERRLAAILHADVHGYSRLLSEDEPATLHTLSGHLQLMQTLVRQHGGRPAGSRGDSLLAEFPSVVEAVQCAVEMQQALRQRNAALPAERRVEFRVGLHLGEIVVEGEQLHGEGINIAVRLEGLASPGGICLSEIVYDQIKSRHALTYEDLGEQTLKNIAKPVRVYRVVLEEADRPQANVQRRKEQGESRKPRRVGTRMLASVFVGVLLLGGIAAVRYFSAPLLSPQSPTPNTQPPAPSTHLLPLPAKPSIIVLPFANLSGDPEQEYFSDGLTEVLTSDLSRISSLLVIARNTAFTYKGKAANVQGVGKELGVRYVLEGSVQKTSNQVRIAVQLIDTATGGHIWSERYDRPLKDIFALQDEIVQKIVTTLGLQLRLQEQGYLVRKRTDNLQAYDYYLRGMEYRSRFTKEADAQARQMFEQAIALDPAYAEAYAELGWSHYLGWSWQWRQDPQALEHALAMGQQAVALGDSLSLGRMGSWAWSMCANSSMSRRLPQASGPSHLLLTMLRVMRCRRSSYLLQAGQQKV